MSGPGPGSTSCVLVPDQMFLSPPRTDDDSTTERKVASMLETVKEIKWTTGESVEGPEERVRSFSPTSL